MASTAMFQVIGGVAVILLIGVRLIRFITNKANKHHNETDIALDFIEIQDDKNIDPEEEEHAVHSPLNVESEQEVDSDAVMEAIDDDANGEIVKNDNVSNDQETAPMIVEVDESNDKDAGGCHSF